MESTPIIDTKTDAATGRRIGPIGTAVRIAGGLALLYLAGADGLSWDVHWYEPVIGLVVLPAIMLAVGLVARHRTTGPLRLTGPTWTCLNCAVIVALVVNPYTAGGALLFYGATMLVAAWWGQPGCEITVIPNVLLRRDDQIGCPTLSVVDEAEARLRRTDSAATC
ncbi:MAG: hypothetical protein ACRD07_15310 [Acidimicrobiales bacterium]